MTGQQVAGAARIPPNAKNVLKRLRSEILMMGEGEYLGSGDDLCQRYLISRPTFHQVARALEHEQLVEVRRGPNGGYYARRPGLNAAVGAVSTYLRAKDTGIWHFITLGRVMHADVCRLAAISTDEVRRSELRADNRTFWSVDGKVEAEVLLRRDYALEGILFALAGNPVVELFMRSMHHFWYELISARLLETGSNRIDLWMSHRRRLCEALLAREERIAMAVSQSHWDLIVAWLEDVVGPDPERSAHRLF